MSQAAHRTVHTPRSLQERYSLAAKRTGPKAASATPGIGVDGYWLASHLYFFIDERIDRDSGLLVKTPQLADVESGRIREVITRKVLLDLFKQSGESVPSASSLASATYDMPDENTLAIALDDRKYLVDPSKQVLSTVRTSVEANALYSPDGRYACIVRDCDLWLIEQPSGTERRLTHDGRPHEAYAQQPESCLAALAYRRHPTPIGLWSPDSNWFLTHRIDERQTPDIHLAQHVTPNGRPEVHRFKYVMPGDPLPVATFVAMNVSTGQQVCFADCPATVLSNSHFSWRMVWFAGRDTAWFLRLDRYFRSAELIRLDLHAGVSRIVLTETVSEGYFEFNQMLIGSPNVRVLADSNEIVWYSERDGWAHLYLYDLSTGQLKHRITSGSWFVRDIVHVDEQSRRIWFTAGGIDAAADPARRSLCSANLDGTGFQVVVACDGDVSVPKTEPCGRGQSRAYSPSYALTGMSRDARHYAVRRSSVTKGNTTEIMSVDGQRSLSLASAGPEPGVPTPRPFTTLAADGVTRLHGVMFVPADFEEHRSYPLIDVIYPGPQVAHQPQSFCAMGAAPAAALAELGFVTIMLDTRGMPARSRKVHQQGYGHLLEPQLADHAAAIKQIAKRFRFIDQGRVGVIGQSGGGAAAARALLDYSDVYHVGVAVCGNHDSTFYSALWSDKYRGEAHPGWAEQANAAAAHKLVGKLLLISGEMDENVHVAQTYTLVDALIRANRDFELLIVPNANHGVLEESGYVVRRTWNFFVTHLLKEEPPREFELRFSPEEMARFCHVAWRDMRW